MIFFIIALISAFFGFGGIASASARIAQILFFVFIIGFFVSIVLHFARKVDRKM